MIVSTWGGNHQVGSTLNRYGGTVGAGYEADLWFLFLFDHEFGDERGHFALLVPFEGSSYARGAMLEPAIWLGSASA